MEVSQNLTNGNVNKELEKRIEELCSNSIRYVRCEESHAMYEGQKSCGFCGKPPVDEGPIVHYRRRRRPFEEILAHSLSIDKDGNEVKQQPGEPENELDLEFHDEIDIPPEFGDDYLDFGLRKCARNHFFPYTEGKCVECEGHSIDTEEDYSARKESDILDFGILTCINDHAFPRILDKCNVCGERRLNTKASNMSPELKRKNDGGECKYVDFCDTLVTGLGLKVRSPRSNIHGEGQNRFS